MSCCRAGEGIFKRNVYEKLRLLVAERMQLHFTAVKDKINKEKSAGLSLWKAKKVKMNEKMGSSCLPILAPVTDAVLGLR